GRTVCAPARCPPIVSQTTALGRSTPMTIHTTRPARTRPGRCVPPSPPPGPASAEEATERSPARMERTSTILAMMTAALKLHQAGDLRQAERIYCDVLRIDPRQGDALNLLGLIANQVGKPEEAIDLLSRAVAAHPHEPEFHNTLAAAYKGVGDVESAVR